MRILFIALLLVGCPDKDDPKNIDPSTTLPAPNTNPQPSPTNTQTKTTPPSKLPDPTFPQPPSPPQPPQTGFALHVFGTKDRLPDELYIADLGGAMVMPADPARYSDYVKFLLHSCARPEVRLFTIRDIDQDDGSAPYELEGRVGEWEFFSVIDTSGAKDAVTGCVLRASITASSGAVTNIEKPVTVRAGKLSLSNPTLTAAGEVGVTVEAESGTPEAYVNLTAVFKVETGYYRLMAINNGSFSLTPNTPDNFTVDTRVFDWGQEEQEQEQEGELETGTYIIFLDVGDSDDSDKGDKVNKVNNPKYWAQGGIEVSL